MAKTKTQKYLEAVERAIPNAGKHLSELQDKGTKDVEKHLKIKLGIRKDDTSFDKRIGL